MNNFQSIDALVGGVKGTTGFLSILLSRKSGLVFLFIVVAAIVSKLILS
ncbi:MAG: hypothetical protein ACXW4Q_08895 [Anaerolineales bacterium]